MKKLSLVLVMVFIVSVAMAQNNALVNQTGGAGNTAFTSQSIAGSNNLLIDQSINGSIGTNVAGVDLLNPILQQGTNNNAKLVQKVSGPTAISLNVAKINQIGDRNLLVGVAAGALDIDVNANAMQVSGTQKNELGVKQSGGNDNKIGLYQSAGGTNSFALSGDVSQLGNRNLFVLYQTAGGNNYDRVYDVVDEQKGDDNIARVVQTATSGPNKVVLKQWGNVNKLVDANAAGYIETGAATQITSAYGTSNMLSVSQIGDWNIAGVHQETTGGAFNTDGNAATINQTGGDHASVYQTGSGNNIANVIQ